MGGGCVCGGGGGVQAGAGALFGFWLFGWQKVPAKAQLHGGLRHAASPHSHTSNVPCCLTLPACLPACRLMAAQISLLQPHLGGKAYSLRSAIVHAIGFLLHKAFDT